MTVKPVNSIPLLPAVDTESHSLYPNQGEDIEDLNACIVNAAQQLVDSWKLRHPSAHVTDTTRTKEKAE